MLKFKSVKGIFGRGRSSDVPEWTKEYESGQPWSSVRNPELVATRRQRINQFWLIAVVCALPVSTFACVLSSQARGQSATAVAQSEAARIEVANADPESPHWIAAKAAVKDRLNSSQHPLLSSTTFEIDHLGFVREGDAEIHRLQATNNFGMVAEFQVAVVASSGNAVGVWVNPPRGAHSHPFESSYEMPSADFFDVPEPIEDDEPEGPDWGRFGGRPVAHIGDIRNKEAVSLPQGSIAKINEWAQAWLVNDQTKLLDLQGQSAPDGGFPFWPFQPVTDAAGNTARGWSIDDRQPVIAVQTDTNTYEAHLRMRMLDPNGVALVIDVVLQISDLNNVVRVESSGPVRG